MPIITNGLRFYWNPKSATTGATSLANIAPAGAVHNALITGSTVGAGGVLYLPTGKTNYITVNHHNDFTSTGSWTVEYIFEPTALMSVGSHKLWEAEDANGGADDSLFEVYRDATTSHINFEVYSGTEATVPIEATATELMTVQRIHLMVVYDSASGILSVFVNDSQKHSQAIVPVRLKVGTTSPILISESSSSISLNFQAMRYYHRALSPAERTENFNNGIEIGLPAPDTTPPAEVTNLSGMPSRTRAVLNWTNPTTPDFSHVKILRNGTQIANNITGGTYTDTPLTAETQYTYLVKTVDMTGNESAGSSLNIITMGNILAKDTFTRPDSTTTLGSTETGQPWTSHTNRIWGIRNNTASPIQNSYDDPIYVNAGESDNVAYSVKMVEYMSSARQIMWRIAPTGRNYFKYEWGTKEVSVVVNGVATVLGTVASFVNDVFKVELRGNEHKIYVNNVLALVFNSSVHINETRFGFASYTVTTVCFDDFLVESISAVAPPEENETVVTTEDFLDDTYAFPVTAGANNWLRSDASAPNGNVGYISSANITHSGTSSISFTLNVPSNALNATLEADWCVSSEAGYDLFSVLVDGVVLLTESGVKQGTFTRLGLLSGSHTVTFRYTKDSSASTGDDKAYVSDMRLSIVRPVSTDSTPPAEVANLNGIPSTTSIILNWLNPPDSDFSHVQILRNGTQVANNITGGTFTDSGLTTDTQYSYRLKTVDTTGNQSTGITASYKTTVVSAVSPIAVFTVSAGVGTALDGGSFAIETINRTIDGGGFTGSTFTATYDGGGFADSFGGAERIAVYPISDNPLQPLRVMTANGLGYIPLVLPTDPLASSTRVQTVQGVRALKKQ